jgi:hypothetical protein
VKKLLTFILITTLALSGTFAQSTRKAAQGVRYQKVISNPLAKMPGFNLKSMLEEDSINQINKVGGMRFAKKFYVNISPENSGEVYIGDDGSQIWKTDITSQNAYTINILFTEFFLPEGAEVYIYNKTQTKIIGPLTSKDNPKSGMLPIPPIQGDTITVEYHAPYNTTTKLRIGEVNHDYRGFKGLPAANTETSDNCSAYTTCVSEINQVKQSVCLLIIEGAYYCSGTLINNTANDGKPYLLTAAHCIDNEQGTRTFAQANLAASKTVFFFNYEVPNCNSTIRGSEEFTIGGAVLKAFTADIDFALMELNTTPTQYFRPFYAGWDINTTPSPPVRGIHHPYGTVKRMNREDNTPTNTTFDSQSLANSHWKIARWELGATESGSSGSGLFDSNFRLIGGLTGGESTCSSPVNDYYFRLNKAWDYYSDATKQLKIWLDPTNTGATSIDGYNPYADTAAVRLTNMSNAETVEKAYLSTPNSGLMTGQNTLNITEYAEKYTAPENTKIYGVYLMPAIAKRSLASTNNIIVKMYAGTTQPEILLASKNIALTTLQWSSLSSFYSNNKKTPYTNKENFIRFSNPVKAGKDFFVAYEIPYTNLPSDSFALYTAVNREIGGTNTIYAKKDGNWSLLSDFSSKLTSLWADPVLSYRTEDIDPDNDGVPDYLDNCPNTPAEAIGYVDTNGCPLDTDGDGVPDYSDTCPNTPVGAYVHLDSSGCPLDTDDDGVPDYLDNCPNTPIGITVDSNGCPIDSDGDGVPDYLDECPNTPTGVTVDAKGCYKGVVIYPTITSNSTKIYFLGYGNGNSTINLYDSLGRLLEQTTVSFIEGEPVNLMLKPLPKGVYYLYISFEGNSVSQKLFIKTP